MLQPIAPDLFEDVPGGISLVGGRCRQTGRYVFPYPSDSDAARFERIRLGQRGALWSWTVQRFAPKTPPYTEAIGSAGFKPYAVGYVELPELIVEARLQVDDIATLKPGLLMESVAVPFVKADGETVGMFAFRPVAKEGSQS